MGVGNLVVSSWQWVRRFKKLGGHEVSNTWGRTISNGAATGEDEL